MQKRLNFNNNFNASYNRSFGTGLPIYLLGEELTINLGLRSKSISSSSIIHKEHFCLFLKYLRDNKIISLSSTNFPKSAVIIYSMKNIVFIHFLGRFI